MATPTQQLQQTTPDTHHLFARISQNRQCPIMKKVIESSKEALGKPTCDDVKDGLSFQAQILLSVLGISFFATATTIAPLGLLAQRAGSSVSLLFGDTAAIASLHPANWKSSDLEHVDFKIDLAQDIISYLFFTNSFLPLCYYASWLLIVMSSWGLKWASRVRFSLPCGVLAVLHYSWGTVPPYLVISREVLPGSMVVTILGILKYLLWVVFAATVFRKMIFRSYMSRRQSLVATAQLALPAAFGAVALIEIMKRFFRIKSFIARMLIRSFAVPFVREIALFFQLKAVHKMQGPGPAERTLFVLPTIAIATVCGHCMQMAANSLTEAVLMEAPTVFLELIETADFLSGNTAIMVWVQRINYVRAYGFARWTSFRGRSAAVTSGEIF